MEIWQIVLCGAPLLTALVLLLRLISLRASLRDIAEDLDDVLQMDTNAQLCVSTADPTVRQIAGKLNRQLRLLRQERLRLQTGDAELRTAVTNISHDLRTPLTAICGYLDLLEQQTHTEESRRYLAVIRARTDAMRAMTEELLRYAVVAATADELKPEPVSMNGYSGAKSCGPLRRAERARPACAGRVSGGSGRADAGQKCAAAHI